MLKKITLKQTLSVVGVIVILFFGWREISSFRAHDAAIAAQAENALLRSQLKVKEKEREKERTAFLAYIETEGRKDALLSAEIERLKGVNLQIEKEKKAAQELTKKMTPSELALSLQTWVGEKEVWLQGTEINPILGFSVFGGRISRDIFVDRDALKLQNENITESLNISTERNKTLQKNIDLVIGQEEESFNLAMDERNGRLKADQALAAVQKSIFWKKTKSFIVGGVVGVIVVKAIELLATNK